MPRPHALARFNLRVTNPAASRIAGCAPWFGIVEHVGRRSGTVRRMPLNVFRTGDRYVVALTYGPDVQWLKNVLASGGATIETRRRRVALTRPELVHDPSHRLVPLPVRPVLRLIGADDFLVLHAA